MKRDEFKILREKISRGRKILSEINSFHKYLSNADSSERKLVYNQIETLRNSLRKIVSEIPKNLENVNLVKKMPRGKSVDKVSKKVSKNKKPSEFEVRKESLFSGSDEDEENKKGKKEKRGLKEFFKSFKAKEKLSKELKPTKLEKVTIKIMKSKDKKIIVKKEKKASKFLMVANNMFGDFSKKALDKKTLQTLEKDLIKASLPYTPHGYISMVLLSTILATVIGVFIALFFALFNVEATLPIITRSTEAFSLRVLKVFWIPLIAPIGTFLIMFLYPSMEKSSAEMKINQELPFATIHMSAISGSMIDPSKIFQIIISTKEYSSIEKEFTRLLNEINIYGYDLVSALRNSAANSPSRKFADLMNGLATTINSGGNLPVFFDKRAQTLLFEHGLEKEKNAKAAETFMDIYISIVIAAPMILMILLMMMKISGLGISLSTQMITLVMVVAVTMINIVFLTFLQLKRGGGS